MHRVIFREFDSEENFSRLPNTNLFRGSVEEERQGCSFNTEELAMLITEWLTGVNLECTQDESGNEVKSKNTKLVKSPMTRALCYYCLHELAPKN